MTPPEWLIFHVATSTIWKSQTVASPDHAEIRSGSAAESGKAAVIVVGYGLEILHAHKIHCGTAKRAGYADCEDDRRALRDISS